MVTAGIDCGAKNTKTIVLRDAEIVGRASILTGFAQRDAINQSLATALADASVSVDQLDAIGGTGSGTQCMPEDARTISDIKAMSMAAWRLFPNVRTVVDVGAEEARAAKISERGAVEDFVINEKCAAGAGTFIEAMARALETPLEELSRLALTTDAVIGMNAQCTIFAESEVVGLIHARTPKADISKAIHDAMASRIVSMIRRVGVNLDIALIGGVANNAGFVQALKRMLNIQEAFIPDAPEYGAALGAAYCVTPEAGSS
jgi:benzoyl-CoA reductase subunit D